MKEEFISQALLLSKTLNNYLNCKTSLAQLLNIKENFDKLLNNECFRK